MNFGEHAMGELEKAAAKLGRRLNRAEVVAQLTQLFEAACPAKRRLVNGRNLLFDAFVDVCALEKDVGDSQGSLIGKCCAEVAKIMGNVPEETMTAEIKRRGAAYVRKYPGAAITPRGIMMHWAEFPPPSGASRKPPMPAGWLTRLNKEFPDSVYSKDGVYAITHESQYEWERLHPTIKERLAT